MSHLPLAVRRFFERVDASETASPPWLKSQFSESVWLIGLPDDCSIDDHAGALVRRVKWGVDMNRRFLTDACYSELLTHLKKVVLRADWASSFGSSPLNTVYRVYSQLANLAEFLSYASPESLERDGLGAVTPALLSRYVSLHASGGVAAVRFYGQRWDAFVLETVGGAVELGGTLSESGPHKSVSAEQIAAMRDWLIDNSWYESSGELRRALVCEAMGASRNSAALYRPVVSRHLAPYELRGDFPAFNTAGRRQRSTNTMPGSDGMVACTSQKNTVQFLRWLQATCRSIPSMAQLPLSKFEAYDFIPISVRGDNRSRTRTRSLSGILPLVERALVFAEVNGEAIVGAWEKIARAASLRAGPLSSQLDRDTAVRRGFDQIKPGEALMTLGVCRVERSLLVAAARQRNPNTSCEVAANLLHSEMGLLDAVDIFRSCAVLLTLLMTCSRIEELVTLDRASLGTREGRRTLTVKLGKRYKDGVKARLVRPIPDVLGRVLDRVARLSLASITIGKSSDPRVSDRLFTVNGNMKLTTLPKQEVYFHLDVLSHYLAPEYAGGADEAWYPRPHECRRLFAMSLFHSSGQQDALPALTWMMGHKGIHETWRYIQEDMSGSEISKVEAELAVRALSDPEKDAGALTLERSLLQHFGVSSLDIVDDESMVEYLEMLHEQGFYTVRPYEIQTRRGEKCAVLTLVVRGAADA